MKTKTLFAALAAVIALCLTHQTAVAQTGAAAPTNRTPEQIADDANRGQAAVDSVLNSMAVLVPGGIEDGSPRKEKLAAAIEMFRQGEIVNTMREFKDLALIDPELPPADVMMAGLTFAIGDNKSGLSLLETSAVKHPKYPGVYLSFAQLALNSGRVADASVHMEKTAALLQSGKLSATQQTHFQKQYHEIMTGIHLRRGQDDLAEESLTQLQAIDPNVPFYLFSKAELAFKKENRDAALQFLKQHALATESKKLPEATMVEWLEATGNNADAEAYLLDTLAKNPDSAQIQFMAAQLFLSKEDFAKALLAIDKFESIEGETLSSIDMKGRMHFAGQNYELAERSFAELTRRQPRDANFQNVYSLCLIESDDPEKQQLARTTSEQIVRRMPQNRLAVAALGYIYLRLGQTEEANKFLQPVAMAPNNSPEISYFVARWLHETGKSTEAAKILEMALETKSLFLYRSASRKLMQEINSAQ